MSNVSNTLLDQVKTAHGLQSDYAVSKALGASRATISGWRHGIRQMDDRLAIEAAKLAGESPLAVLADLQAERSKSDETRSYWKELADLARGATKAAAVAVAAMSMLAAAAISGTPAGQGFDGGKP